MSKQSHNSSDVKYNPYGLEDPELDAFIKDFKRAEHDLEEIFSDPCLETVRQDVNSMINEYVNAGKVNEKNRSFIKNSLTKDAGSKHQDDLKQIFSEKSSTNVNELSAEWVNEWHRKKQMLGALSPEEEERRKFITGSLKNDQPAEKAIKPRIITLKRIAYVAAAAVIGIMVLIGSLGGGPDPLKIYGRYHEPFDAMTTVVRGNISTSSLYSEAVSYYKTGHYAEAAAGFREAVLNDPSNIAALFYQGVSELETGNTDQAISSLETAAGKQGTFYKETRWYLGLAYLKKGDKTEAAKNFSVLADDEGYYSKRASAILRRLK